jgi:hypothetical protein
VWPDLRLQYRQRCGQKRKLHESVRVVLQVEAVTRQESFHNENCWNFQACGFEIV